MQTERLHLTNTGALETEFVPGEALERFDALAGEALEQCRTQVMMAMRFLNAALWHMPSQRAVLPRTLSCDGRVARYDPERVVDQYGQDANELVRDYIHMVLHCVFHHPFEKRYAEYAAWSLAVDVCVELCAIELSGQRFPSARDAERVEAASRLVGLARNTTAPALYQVMRSGAAGEAIHLGYGLGHDELRYLADLFARDDHGSWAVHPSSDDEPGGMMGGSSEAVVNLQGAGSSAASQAVVPGSSDAPSSGGEDGEGAGEGDASDWSVSPDAADGPPPGEDPDVRGEADAAESADTVEDEQRESASDDEERVLKATLEEWTKISKRVDAEMRVKQHSLSGTGSLLQNLTVANRKPADYSAFLQKFATMAEDVRISDEEFDYIFYTYGINRYGNIPLVEPLEYRESNRVREFVIALDTSGSCSGELIRAFVARTYDILRQKTSFGDDIDVHIVQCDNRVRTATKVTSLRQLEEYADSFWVSGGGGTDFRPVFDYVDALVDNGEFNDLRGLIYFTDGYGAYPAKAPDYDVAFVFVDREATDAKVPAWACKVVMTAEEVADM